MKTWICKIFGGGTPMYLVSAETEKDAWKMIESDLGERYTSRYFSLKRDTGGLVEVPFMKSDGARIVDIFELTGKTGSFDGLGY